MELKDLGKAVEAGLLRVKGGQAETQLSLEKLVSIVSNEVISKVNAFYDDKKVAIEQNALALHEEIAALANAATDSLREELDAAKKSITDYVAASTASVGDQVKCVAESAKAMAEVSTKATETLESLEKIKLSVSTDMISVRDAFACESKEYAAKVMADAMSEISKMILIVNDLCNKTTKCVKEMQEYFEVDSKMSNLISQLLEKHLLGALKRQLLKKIGLSRA